MNTIVVQRVHTSKSIRTVGILICWVFAFAFLLSSGNAFGRQNTLTGRLSALQWYDSNIYRTDTDTQSEWNSVLTPAMTLTSLGEHDSLALTYAPGLVFNNRTEKTRLDHFLELDAAKEFKKTTFDLHETFIRSEDPYTSEEREIEIVDKRGKNRYWINAVAANIGYTYAEDSVLTLGYANDILKNKDQSRDDYVKHTPSASITYRFSPRWQTLLSHSYINGNFDQGEDLDINTSTFRLNHNYNPLNTVFGQFEYSKGHYRGPTEDYSISTPSAGWDYRMNPKTQVLIELGVSFLKRDVSDDRQAPLYDVAVKRELRRGSLSLGGQGGFSERRFTGVSLDGLSEFWAVNAALEYKLLEDLTSELHTTYRHDKYIERITDDTEKGFSAGAALTYSFYRWYAFSARYEYYQLNADNSTDDYEDNRVYFELIAKKDLLNW